MKVSLTALEARVIACLLEKQVTTPDQYPLSLNALTNACNQKTNRDPVMELAEATVQGALDGLARKHLVIEKSGFGSRVPKYQHVFCNTQFGSLKFSPQELALLCELMLRGPQTPGELRSRASRMAPFTDVSQIEALLDALAGREDGPFVVCLPREPGRRESRYAQLFTGTPSSEGERQPRTPSEEPIRRPGPETTAGTLEVRVAELERAVQELRAQLAALTREK